jgi:hypothetical protein
MRLTSEQLAFFRAFGYLALPGLVAHRIAGIVSEFEEVWRREGGGHAGRAHDPTKRSCLGGFIDRSGPLATLLDDPAITDVAESLMGEDFNYTGSDGNLYAGDTPWHSDGWHDEVLNVKFAFYLDPVDRDSGCLRVIPGSHLPGPFAEGIRDKLRGFGVAADRLPDQALASRPGDVLVFNHNIQHASFRGTGRRRMFTMNMSERIPERLVPKLREDLLGAVRFWVDEAYLGADAPMRRDADAKRMRRLQQIIDNWDSARMRALVAEARGRMAEPARG